MKKTNYYCDNKDCKKELKWDTMYYIVDIKTHTPNMSYSTTEDEEKHFCKECFESRY